MGIWVAEQAAAEVEANIPLLGPAAAAVGGMTVATRE